MALPIYVVVVKTREDLRKIYSLPAICVLALIRDAVWKRTPLEFILRSCEEDVCIMQRLGSRLNGTHPLHQYQAAIADVAADRSSKLYRSLKDTTDDFCAHLGQPTPISQLEHNPTTLILRLPADWQGIYHEEDIEGYVLDQDTLLTSHCMPEPIAEAILNVVMENWHLTNIAFFFPLLPNLHSITIQGVGCESNNWPLIPYPYMLPSTVRHLTLKRVIFEKHALEAMLSPGTRLESLALIEVIKGYLPTLGDRNEWRERWGITTLLQTEIYAPPTNSLKHLILHSPMVDDLPSYQPKSTEDREQSQVLMDFAFLISQLFGIAPAGPSIQRYLRPGEQFPRRLGMQSLTKLNLALAIGHFELLGKSFGVVGPTLRELTIRYSECAAIAPAERYPVLVSLSELGQLEHFTMDLAANALPLGLWAAQTWTGASKTRRSSKFTVVIRTSPDIAGTLSEHLHSSALKEALLGSPVSDTSDDSTHPFGGQFLLSFKTSVPHVVVSSDFDHAIMVLDSMYQSEDILAYIAPCTMDALSDSHSH